jgi:hypothetical protein
MRHILILTLLLVPLAYACAEESEVLTMPKRELLILPQGLDATLVAELEELSKYFKEVEAVTRRDLTEIYALWVLEKDPDTKKRVAQDFKDRNQERADVLDEVRAQVTDLLVEVDPALALAIEDASTAQANEARHNLANAVQARKDAEAGKVSDRLAARQDERARERQEREARANDLERRRATTPSATLGSGVPVPRGVSRNPEDRPGYKNPR